MRKRDRLWIVEIADAITAVAGVSNPCNALGVAQFYEEMTRVRAKAYRALSAIADPLATDGEREEAMEELRAELRTTTTV